MVLLIEGCQPGLRTWLWFDYVKEIKKMIKATIFGMLWVRIRQLKE